MLHLSVLDLIPLHTGQTPQDALGDAVELAQAADRLGYHRYWVAEHHNATAIASTAPAVVLAHLGHGTKRIRLGSGGVMLPNHAPLVVAEQFALLEAMYPGRVDLGLGRAPGTDPITARALRRDLSEHAVQRYPANVLEVAGLLGTVHERADAELFDVLHAAAAVPHAPEIWLLGSSLYSAELAGILGMRYAYANHFGMGSAPGAALDHYRRHFAPSAGLGEPRAMVSATVLVADSVEDAVRQDVATRVFRYQLLTAGRPEPLLAPDDAAEFAERVKATDGWARAGGSQYLGPAADVAAGLRDLAARVGADELIVQPTGFDVATRTHSLEALAAAWV